MTKTKPKYPEPADAVPALVAPGQKPPCGPDPRSRFDPITGQPCDVATPPTERIVVRQTPASREPNPATPAQHEPTREEKRLLAAYQSEQGARPRPNGDSRCEWRRNGQLEFRNAVATFNPGRGAGYCPPGSELCTNRRATGRRNSPRR
jgi:hypothetical protein